MRKMKHASPFSIYIASIHPSHSLFIILPWLYILIIENPSHSFVSKYVCIFFSHTSLISWEWVQIIERKTHSMLLPKKEGGNYAYIQPFCCFIFIVPRKETKNEIYFSPLCYIPTEMTISRYNLCYSNFSRI